MTTVSAPPPRQAAKEKFDPDQFRMTIGEHLEELRWRLILGLIGFAVALAVCMTFGEKVLTVFTLPLVNGLKKHGLSTQLFYTNLTDVFMTYLQISIICAIALAGPWMIYQLWLFVAAGLYPNERKTITRYIPLSVSLLVAGLLFVYFLVMPMTVDFFLSFSSALPLPSSLLPSAKEVQNVKFPFTVPQLDGDPVDKPEGAIWFNRAQDRLKVILGGKLRVITFGPENLLSPHLTLNEYIDLVMTFMLVFGVAFQLPLVLLALVSVGLLEIDFLRKQRRIVYFVMAIVAAVIAPGDVVTSMLALLIPLLLLYEFGIWLAIWGEKRRQRRERAEAA